MKTYEQFNLFKRKPKIEKEFIKRGNKKYENGF